MKIFDGEGKGVLAISYQSSSNCDEMTSVYQGYQTYQTYQGYVSDRSISILQRLNLRKSSFSHKNDPTSLH